MLHLQKRITKSLFTTSLTGKQIGSNEALTSPMLTLLLDIPWASYQPMWPFFGFLAQMAIKRVQSKQNDFNIDGLQGPELQQFVSYS